MVPLADDEVVESLRALSAALLYEYRELRLSLACGP